MLLVRHVRMIMASSSFTTRSMVERVPQKIVRLRWNATYKSTGGMLCDLFYKRRMAATEARTMLILAIAPASRASKLSMSVSACLPAASAAVSTASTIGASASTVGAGTAAGFSGTGLGDGTGFVRAAAGSGAGAPRAD